MFVTMQRKNVGEEVWRSESKMKQCKTKLILLLICLLIPIVSFAENNTEIEIQANDTGDVPVVYYADPHTYYPSFMVGIEIGIYIKTSQDTETLYMYDDEGLCASWSSDWIYKENEDDSVWWDVWYTFRETGNKTLTFVASNNFGNSDEKTITITVEENIPEIVDAWLIEDSVNIGEAIEFEAYTSLNTDRLNLYDNGVLCASWTEGWEADDDYLLWQEEYYPTEAGNRMITIKAENAYSESKRNSDDLQITVLDPTEPTIIPVDQPEQETPTIKKASIAEPKVEAQKDVSIVVETSMDAKELYMYSGDTLLQTWTEGYRDEGDTRIWEISTVFSETGEHTITFIAGNDESLSEKVDIYVFVVQTHGIWGKLVWDIGDDGVLTISGSGEMNDFDTWDVINAWRPCAQWINEIVITANIESVGNYAFFGCENLSGITFPDQLTRIGDHSFYGCVSLTEVMLPNSLVILDNCAFDSCKGLKQIIIPDSVVSVGNYLFAGCDSLEEVTISKNIAELSEHMFHDCISLSTAVIPENVNVIKGCAFAGCNSLVSILIPDNVNVIEDWAFWSCKNLKAVNISACVTDIGNNTFNESDLVNIYCYENSAAYIHAETYGIKHYILDTPLTSADFILPDDLRIIEAEAMKGNVARRIKLGEKTEEIGREAFADCQNLVQIYIPATCTNIALDAFAYSYGITIFAENGSFAETYANGNGFMFTPVSTLSERIKKYIMNGSTYYDDYLDTNKDGTIGTVDYIIAKKAGL